MQPSNSTGSSNESSSGLPGGLTAPLQRQDTPRKSGTPTSRQNVTLHRSEIIDQMREEMVSCTKWDETGFGHYLPFKVSTADIENAVNALKGANLILEIESTLRFKNFPVRPSNISTANEKTRYGPLESIAKKLQNLTLCNGRKASCEFRQQPDVSNGAETHGANFKIDAHLRLKQSTMPSGHSSSTNVADIAVPLEYKTYRSEARQNRKQLLGTTNFCMNDDPRRTHIYGITIEDDTMAVWYFSRSHSAKSPDFNFTEDCRTYIEVMLSLMFATEEELGYDPTIWRRLDPETRKLCFVYNVDRRYYKTLRAIFDRRSLCITGRTTRVWKVIEVGSFDDLQPLEDSQPMVLKDFWLDAGSKTEGNIQRELFGDLQRISDELKENKEPEGFEGMDDESKKILRGCLLAEDWKRYFLTVVCEWQGMKSKEVADTAEPDSKLFDAPRVTTKAASVPYADLSRMRVSQPTALLPHKEKSVNRRYSPKQQSRIVFEQVCMALHDLPTLGDVLTTLSSCVFALQLMFLAGWVHRDISSGNLYRFENKNGEVQGILADLEYAKRFQADGNGSSDPKTGTAYFMAIEIQKQALLYTPPAEATLQDDFRSAIRKITISQRGRPVVVHNFEHDMESIFWILLWTILVRFPSNLGLRKKQEKNAIIYEIFQDTSTCHPTREEVFTHDGTLPFILAEYLDPQLKSLDLDFQVIALRYALMYGYQERKYNFSNMPSYSNVYRELLKTLSDCQQSIRGRSLPDLVPCDQAEATETARLPHQVRKRRHNQPNAGKDDDECSPVASKKMRGQENTDMLL